MKNLSSFFRGAALSNWILGFSSIFHKAQFAIFGLEAPHYSTLIIFTGMLGVVLGVLYWDIAQFPNHRLELLKIGLLSKSGGSIIWLIGLVTGDLPSPLWFYACWADFMWLPGFIYYYRLVKKESRRFK